MLVLAPVQPSDAALINAWVNGPKGLFQFAGPQFEYPVTAAQMETYLASNHQKPFMVLSDKGEKIGHCEFNYQNPQVPRLSRLLIAPNHRGKGYGQMMVRLMVERLFEEAAYKMIDLRVFEWNKQAIQCYEKIGFEINPAKTGNFPVLDTTWVRLCMELNRANYKRKNPKL